MYYVFLCNSAFIMVNFYEAIDEVFDKLIEDKQGLFQDIVKVKSDIISAYEMSTGYEGRAIAKMLKVKHFKIAEDGTIITV